MSLIVLCRNLTTQCDGMTSYGSTYRGQGWLYSLPNLTLNALCQSSRPVEMKENHLCDFPVPSSLCYLIP